MAATIAHDAPSTRAILEDRWAGIMQSRTDPLDPSGRQNRLDALLEELVVGVSRERKADDDPIVEQVETVIREMILRHAEALREQAAAYLAPYLIDDPKAAQA